MSTLLLAAVNGTRVKACVTFAADHLLTVVFLRQLPEGRLDDPSSQTQHQVQGGLFLNVIVGQCASIFQLFASENQTLLVRRDAFLVLNLGFDILNGVTGLHLEGDGFAGQRFHEDLHFPFT